MSERTAVVTGASSGIGAATVRRLSKNGWRVYAAARRLDRLEALAAETGAVPVAVDITDDESVGRLAEVVDDCHLLVNNAGGAIGLDRVETADINDWRQMFELNVLGTIRVTKALLLQLRRVHGDVVTITSTAGHIAYEGGGGYVASKQAERAIVETLRLELCGEQIRVIEIAPGMVHTEEFSLKRLEGDAGRASAVYEGVDRPLTADDVAQCIESVVSLPPHVNVDSMIVRPLAQAAQHKLHKGPLV